MTSDTVEDNTETFSERITSLVDENDSYGGYRMILFSSAEELAQVPSDTFVKLVWLAFGEDACGIDDVFEKIAPRLTGEDLDWFLGRVSVIDFRLFTALFLRKCAATHREKLHTLFLARTDVSIDGYIVFLARCHRVLTRDQRIAIADKIADEQPRVPQ